MEAHDTPKVNLDQQLLTSWPGFRSFKTARPIVYGQRWHRDVLIQLTLDPHVGSLRRGSRRYRPETLALRILTRAGDVDLLAFRDEHQEELPRPSSKRVLLRRSDVLADPKATNARMIWAMRRKPISPADRLRILIRLEEAPNGLPLAELLECVCSSPVEPVEAILALVCQGQLLIDYLKPIGPSATLRSSIGADLPASPAAWTSVDARSCLQPF